MYIGGTAFDRARLPAVGTAEPSGVDFVEAALHRAHLRKKYEEKEERWGVGAILNDTHPTGLIERVLFNLNAAPQIRSYPKRQRIIQKTIIG